jgi:hypothetical protein
VIKQIADHAMRYGEPNTSLVKLASRGLRGRDLDAFVKRAGHDFLSALDQVRPGETPVHLIAMGATERYGPNRNYDGFTVPMLRRYHPTFEKHARWYRNHENSDPNISYGRVIKSAFDETLQRVELLVGLFRTEEAARRGGGLVEKHAHDLLHSGDDVAVSMSIKVPYDVCLGCGNQAPNRAHYCDSQTVKMASGKVIPACPRGGVRRHMGLAHEDGFVNYVDNPVGTFFDISDVSDTRPADRIAYTVGLMTNGGRG